MMNAFVYSIFQYTNHSKRFGSVINADMWNYNTQIDETQLK